MRMHRTGLLLGIAVGFAACSPSSTESSTHFRAEVWADNWFAFSLGEKAIAEDSVAITTERSFNKEVFEFDGEYPLALNFTLKDYKANDTGLEYIGTAMQQMGDGGFIAQIKDGNGKLVAASSASWKCLVVHRAPLNVACEKSATPQVDCTAQITPEPSGWMSASYDFSAWPAAVEYTAAAVSPKDGYNQVSWDASAKLIWSAGLEQDNTLLCKTIISAQSS